MSVVNDFVLKILLFNYIKVKKWIHNGVIVFKAGNMVTYYVDTNTVYKEEVDSGASCLSPTTFTPSKSGWTFVGWRADKTASGTVLSSQVMGDEAITLYAVYKQTITLSYNGNGSTSGSTASQTGTRYYNASGSVANPSFTLRSNGFAKNGGNTFSKWALGSTGGTQYAAGATVTLSASTIFYAVWVGTDSTNLTSITVNSVAIAWTNLALAWKGSGTTGKVTYTHAGGSQASTYSPGNGTAHYFPIATVDTDKYNYLDVYFDSSAREGDRDGTENIAFIAQGNLAYSTSWNGSNGVAASGTGWAKIAQTVGYESDDDDDIKVFVISGSYIRIPLITGNGIQTMNLVVYHAGAVAAYTEDSISFGLAKAVGRIL